MSIFYISCCKIHNVLYDWKTLRDSIKRIPCGDWRFLPAKKTEASRRKWVPWYLNKLRTWVHARKLWKSIYDVRKRLWKREVPVRTLRGWLWIHVIFHKMLLPKTRPKRDRDKVTCEKRRGTSIFITKILNRGLPSLPISLSSYSSSQQTVAICGASCVVWVIQRHQLMHHLCLLS